MKTETFHASTTANSAGRRGLIRRILGQIAASCGCYRLIQSRIADYAPRF